ncbi:hypothetical protein [Paenibacillus pectinilyticus]|uniref:hypothetical protein n=1 Tax=Paenibacillus pectinilyticus TaxID=512399 RepID=UPI00114CCC72|nr:hypothetical protein [Paenibacillus pectinilyticus]
MSSICPVCNGLQEVQTDCPVCSQRMSDYGKLSDLLGPYSPYEMDGISSSMGNSHDLQNHCLHLVTCPNCQSSYTLQIPAL